MADPTVIKAAKSDNLYATNEQPVDMFSSMFKSFPSLTPVISILSKLASTDAFNSRIDWTEQRQMPDEVIVTGNAGTGTTLTTAGRYTFLRQYDLLYNPKTYEVIMVNDTTAGDDADTTVIRGWGGTTAVATEVGHRLRRMGNGYPENSEAAYPRHVVNDNFYNYTQEVHKTTRHSERTMHEKTHFGGKGSKRDEDNSKMFYDWRKEFEMAVMLGTRTDTLVSGETGYTKTFGGIVEKLRNGTNFFNVGGILTETAIEEWLNGIYGSYPDSQRLLWVMSPKVYMIVNQLVKPLIRVSPNTKAYGMNLKQYDGPVTADMVKHPLLTGPGFEEWSFMLDLDYWRVVYQKKPVMTFDVAMKRYNYTEDKLHGIVSLLGGSESRHGMMVGAEG